MSLEKELKDALKEGKAILGFRKSLKYLKTNKPKLVIIAENIPERYKIQILHNAKISKVKVKIFKGSSKELGVLCGKPFPVSTVVIK